MGRRLVDALCASLVIAGAASVPVVGAQGLGGGPIFDGACAHCHGADGRGGPIGPAIFDRVAESADDELAEFLRAGVPDRGMPPAPVAGAEMSALIGYLRALASAAPDAPTSPEDVTADLPIAASAFDTFRPLHDVQSDSNAGDWLGGADARRFTALDEIDRQTVPRLTLAWSRGLPAGPIVPSPIVYGGVLYIVMPDESAAALDAATGDVLWQRRAEEGAAAGGRGGNAERAGARAGSAEGDADTLRPPVIAPVLHEDGLYYVSPRTAIVALDARTGTLRWEASLIGDPRSLRERVTVFSPPVFADGRIVIERCAPRGSRCTLSALNARTGELLWRDEAAAGEPPGDDPASARTPGDDSDTAGAPGGEILVTGGGLIFQSLADRRFAARDAQTGDVLWQTILGSDVVTSMLGYAANGRQHVAVVNGGDVSAQDAAAELRGWGGPGALYVFALPPADEQDRQ